MSDQQSKEHEEKVTDNDVRKELQRQLEKIQEELKSQPVSSRVFYEHRLRFG